MLNEHFATQSNYMGTVRKRKPYRETHPHWAQTCLCVRAKVWQISIPNKPSANHSHMVCEPYMNSLVRKCLPTLTFPWRDSKIPTLAGTRLMLECNAVMVYLSILVCSGVTLHIYTYLKGQPLFVGGRYVYNRWMGFFGGGVLTKSRCSTWTAWFTVMLPKSFWESTCNLVVCFVATDTQW